MLVDIGIPCVRDFDYSRKYLFSCFSVNLLPRLQGTRLADDKVEAMAVAMYISS